jgi:hypothetical protein
MLHEEYVLVPADKDCNSIVFVCKAHYYYCIINELGINSMIGNRTCIPTTFSKDEIVQNNASVLNTLNNHSNVDDDYELPHLYWIPKLYKTPSTDLAQFHGTVFGFSALIQFSQFIWDFQLFWQK